MSETTKDWLIRRVGLFRGFVHPRLHPLAGNGQPRARVDSDSEEEALAKFNKDGGDFVDEEIEVTSTGDNRFGGFVLIRRHKEGRVKL